MAPTGSAAASAVAARTATQTGHHTAPHIVEEAESRTVVAAAADTVTDPADSCPRVDPFLKPVAATGRPPVKVRLAQPSVNVCATGSPLVERHGWAAGPLLGDVADHRELHVLARKAVDQAPDEQREQSQPDQEAQAPKEH